MLRFVAVLRLKVMTGEILSLFYSVGEDRDEPTLYQGWLGAGEPSLYLAEQGKTGAPTLYQAMLGAGEPVVAQVRTSGAYLVPGDAGGG
jgi:hypothetical protein